MSCLDLGCLGAGGSQLELVFYKLIINAMRLTGRSFYIAKVDADLLNEYNEGHDGNFEARLHSHISILYDLIYINCCLLLAILMIET